MTDDEIHAVIGYFMDRPLRYLYTNDIKMKRQNKKHKIPTQAHKILKLPPDKAASELKLIQTDIRRAIDGAKLTIRKPTNKTRQTMTPTRQTKIGRDKTTTKLHIER